MSSVEAESHRAELVPLSELTPHPRNYRAHPLDQIEHIKASIVEHGFYRNVVVASDGVILAGHGVVEASTILGLSAVPVVRLPIASDSPQALKVMAGDNRIATLAFDDDRVLTDLLRELALDDDLLGTGFDETQLAGLLLVTRPASEVASFDAAAEWVGMPDYESEPDRWKLILSCETEEERDALQEQLAVVVAKRTGKTVSAWYPPRPKEDLASLRFEAPTEEEA